MTLTPFTRLGAVNAVLRASGLTRVSSLNAPISPDTANAIDLVDTATRELQTKSWYFNTQKDYPLVQDGNGRYPVPPSASEADVDGLHVEVRDGFLYNLETNTDIFDAGTGELRAVVVFVKEFDDLPLPAKIYIGRTAAREFAESYSRNPQLIQAAFLNEAVAAGHLKAQQTRQADESIYGTTAGARILSRIPPGSQWR